MRIKSKMTKHGLVEIIQSGSRYSLVVNDVIKKQSADLNYILGEYDRY